MSQLDPHAQAQPDPRWARFRLIAIFSVLAVSLGSWWLCSKGGENSPVEPLELGVLSLKELYPETLSIAKEWQSDALFFGASFSLFESDQTIDLLATFFFWGDISDSGRWLNVYFRGTPVNLVTYTEEGDYPPSNSIPVRIDPEDSPFDSVEALGIILANGAEEFLRAHPNQPWPPRLILERSGPWLAEGPLRWRAFFKGDDLHDTEHFKIDAYTGELLE